MKHLKKYNESKTNLNNLSDDELKDKLKWLRIEYTDIQDEITTISSILRSRKEKRETSYSSSFPSDIFKLNKEQLDWVLEHNHKTTEERYKISHKYIQQLSGVVDSGFNINTNQYYFQIVVSRLFNPMENAFELNPNIVSSIKLLSNNLKKTSDDYVEFGILYYYNDHSYNDKVKFYSEDNIEWGDRYNWRKVNSIESLLESLVEYDLTSKNDEDY
jgi:hypothetical protein